MMKIYVVRMVPNNDITNNSHTCNKNMDDIITKKQQQQQQQQTSPAMNRNCTGLIQTNILFKQQLQHIFRMFVVVVVVVVVMMVLILAVFSRIYLLDVIMKNHI